MPRHRPTPPAAASPPSQPLHINISSTNDDPTNLRFEVDGTPYAPVGSRARTRTPARATPTIAPAPATQVIVPAHPRSTCRSLLASGLRRYHNLARLGHQTCWAHANTPAASLVAADDEDGDYVTESDSETDSEEEEEEREEEQRSEDHDLDQADLVTGLYLGRVAGANASRRRTREALDRLAQVLRDWEF